MVTGQQEHAEPGTTEPLDRRDLLLAFLAQRDVLCPRCEYNLRGLRSPRCPECGDELELHVALVHPKLGPYVALICAGCAGLGGGLLLAAIALVEAPASWWFGEVSAWAMQALIVISAVSLLLARAKRRSFRLLIPSRQRWLAAAAWLVVAALAAVIIHWFPG